jgi:hypothetical protein
MKKRYSYLLTVLTTALVLAVVFEVYVSNHSTSSSPDVYIGVDAAYSNIKDIEGLVDTVKSYTNFFIIGSNTITYNITNLNNVCQYISGSGMYFAPFMHTNPEAFNQTQWVIQAGQTWEKNFWGLFPYDEPGGVQIDRARSSLENGNISLMLVQQANNYTDAANKFASNLRGILAEYSFNYVPLMTSDYALHEFDYRGGYDVVLAEFGYNLSRPMQVALCRGAATMQNKDWGVIITWKYNQPPYLESGVDLYNDMVFAYENGAKYIIVFDSNENYTQNVLQQEHFEAMQQFWQYAQKNPRNKDTNIDRSAYVLPAGYGFGFRRANDTIWGLWQADSISGKIWNDTNTLINSGLQLDIIFEDDLQFGIFNYDQLIFWNQTTLNPLEK